MATPLGFEQKVEGLIDYYNQLVNIDPSLPNYNGDINPDIFYSSPIGVRAPLAEARQSVRFNIGCHARLEYTKRGFNVKDLRSDTDEERTERADLLGMTTAPIDLEGRIARGQRLKGILKVLEAGEPLEVKAHTADHFPRFATRAQLDAHLPLYAFFDNGHISSRVLGFQYFAPTSPVSNHPVLSFDLNAVFEKDIVEVTTAA